MSISKEHPEVHKAYINSAGDRSVGIQPATFTAEIFIPKNEPEVLEEIRKRLAIIYEVMVDEKVTVLFDFEVEACVAKERQLAREGRDLEEGGGVELCGDISPEPYPGRPCVRFKGHAGDHRSKRGMDQICWVPPKTLSPPAGLCGAQMRGKHDSDHVHVCTLRRGHKGLHEAGERRW